MKTSDIEVGSKYGSWTVICQAPRRNGKKYFYCTCDCGKEKSVDGYSLVSGASTKCKSCLGRIIGKKSARHGKYKSGAWRSWSAMMERTMYKIQPGKHKSYVERGIKVIPPLDNFEAFYDHLGDRPDGMSVDRINTNGHYEVGNVRWATQKQQSKNRTNSVVYTFDSKTMDLIDWSLELGISPECMAYRLQAGWPYDQVFNSFKDHGRRVISRKGLKEALPLAA